jgi:hypothetical protein
MWKSNLPPELEALNQLCTNSIHTLDEQAQSLTKTVANWCLQDRHVEEWMAKSANEASCTSQLGELDGLVDELAFSCQVFDRYVALIQGHSPHTTIQELHPEWTWKYASLERYLTTQQLQSALALAHPVQIVLGTPSSFGGGRCSIFVHASLGTCRVHTKHPSDWDGRPFHYQ